MTVPRFPAALLLLHLAGCAGARSSSPAADTAPATDIETSLFLLGDAGDPDPDFEPVLAALAAGIETSGARPVVAFLGDNIYPSGLPPATHPDRREAERRLAAQVRTVMDAGGEAIFVPGNHDWNYGERDGLARVRGQAALVETLGGGRAQLLPAGGCPGPAVLDVGTRLRLIVIDTEWWLQDPGVRAAADGACPERTEAGVTAAIARALASTGDRHALVLAHHPLQSGGVHGGHFTWTQHLFPLRDLASWAWLPLPLVGSLYPLIRGSGISDQDLPGGGNERMRAALEAALRVDPPLAYASGHEHNLQVLEGTSARWLLVSGGGIHGHTTPVRFLANTRFAAQRSGYMRVDVQRDGRARLAVVVVDGRGAGREVMAVELSSPMAQ